jgi:hypothetical protein
LNSQYLVFPTLALAASLLSACGGDAAAPPVSDVAPASFPDNQTTSWMAAGAAQQQSLLYVTNFTGNNVGVYSYDAGKTLTLVGSLQVPEPSGVCSDKKGHVFIASQHGHAVHEFDRGGTKPIFVIKLAQAGIPAGCAVDPSSGELAVAINKPNAKFIGHFAAVLVFASGSDRGQEYDYSGGFYSVSFPAYDNKGNLFVDGSVCRIYYYCYTIPDTPPGLFELSRHANGFTQLKLKGVAFNEPTGLAWIKPTLLVAENSQSNNGKVVGYKMLIGGGSATLVQTLPFKGAASAGGIAERAGVAIIADPYKPAVQTYSISNGDPLDSLLKGLSAPYAVAVSQARVKSSIGDSK